MHGQPVQCPTMQHTNFLRFFILLLALLAGPAVARAAPPAGPLPEVGFSIVKTGTLQVREGVVYSGGDFSKKLDNIYSAILIKHAGEFILFDTGLGSNIAAQYQQDMPLWLRPFFKYQDPVLPVKEQLESAGIGPLSRIVLSHSHWDHASGITDFPGTPVLVAPEELAAIRQPAGKLGAPWPSQVGDKSIQWQSIAFEPRPYEGFERSLDLYKNGKIVLVPMYGHTPGSVGLFLTVDSGKRYFFVGDVVWSAGALVNGNPKFWAARMQADGDATQTQATIEQVRAAMQRDPTLVVVPAHDGTVQNALGYFPAWVR
jgi:glyoxylase-like metal-dependent hydrolase (beta-lactamase superfamily II)